MTRKLTWFLVAGMLIAVPGQHASCQTSSVQPSATPPDKAASAQQKPAYEVATINPPNRTGMPALYAYTYKVRMAYRSTLLAG
jgi:hypothetical protein